MVMQILGFLPQNNPAPPNIPTPTREPLGDRSHPPLGRNCYSFSPKPVPEIPEQIVSNESQTRDVLEAIKERYEGVLEEREAIGRLMVSFKESLGVVPESEFPACFTKLQSQLQRRDEVTLNKDGPPQIEITQYQPNQELPESVSNAVSQFNEMMRKCQEFLGGIDEATTFIEEKLAALQERVYYITQGLKETWDKYKAFPAEIRSCATEMESIKNDVVAAESHFSSCRTGAIFLSD